MSFLDTQGLGKPRLAPHIAAIAKPAYKVSVGIEGTLEPVSGRHTLTSTKHFRARGWSRDFALVREIGVQEVRYPIPWHVIERERGKYHWGQMDRVLTSAIDEHGLSIIADPLHHTSYPRWLEGGFLNPDFVEAYPRFVEAIAERYPAIKIFTPFNEPTCTLDFCGNRGFWHPFAKGDVSYVTMLRHTALGTAEAIRRIKRVRPDAYILYVDTFERHAALDAASEPRALFLNERRFIFEELITGKVDAEHALYGFLVKNGFPRSDLAALVDDPVEIDERGGNYYPLNEEQLLAGETHAAPSGNPVGLASVVREYAQRVRYPLSMTETNIQGTVGDRISWLKHMLEQVEQLQAGGIEMRRFAWYPLFDCCGWNSLLQGKRWSRDPQGIFTCDADWTRFENEFSRIYRGLAEGMTSASIPAYTFSSRHDGTLGPLKAHMNWDWVEQPASLAQAW